MLVALLKKQIMTLKLQKLKINLIIIVMINILIRQFNKLAVDVFNARIAQANLITKTDFDDKLSNLNRKLTSNKTKSNFWKWIKKAENIWFELFYFEEDGAQNYLVFQLISIYFKINGKYILLWKSKGLSDETIKLYATSDNSLTPLIDYYGTRIRLKFNRSYLKQPNKLTYDYGHKGNVYFVYELGASSSNDSDSTLKIVYLVQLL